MEIGIDESEPEDSIDRYAVDTYSTGEEMLEIPSHWHKVRSQQQLKLETLLLDNAK